MASFSSAVIFLVIAVPWHIAAGMANPSQGQQAGAVPTRGKCTWFFLVLFLQRTGAPVSQSQGSTRLRYGSAVALLGIARGLVDAVDRICVQGARSGADEVFRRRVRVPRHDQAWNLLGIWAGFVMVFFSFSTRQEYYALPALPPIALMIGGWLNREEKCHARDPRRIAGRRIAVVLFFLGMIGPLSPGTWHTRPSPGARDGYFQFAYAKSRRLCAVPGPFS